MADMQTQTRHLLDTVNADGTFSYFMEEYITYKGQEIALTNHRKAYVPGDDISGLPENLQAVISQGLWTPDVLDEWNKNHPDAPEWDETVEYSAGDIVRRKGYYFISLSDNNMYKPLPDNKYWSLTEAYVNHDAPPEDDPYWEVQ